MNNIAKEMKQNVVDMIKDLGKMHEELKDKTLAQEFIRFLHTFITASISLGDLMKVVDSKISGAKLSKHTTADGMTSKAIGSFWETVQTRIMTTYEKNKVLEKELRKVKDLTPKNRHRSSDQEDTSEQSTD